MRSTQFLIRPKALEGESLSSWRQRVAWANGYYLFPVPDERTRRADPDVGENEAELQWVSDLHGVSRDTAERMTLRVYVGKVISHLASRSQPRWWLRARYGIPSPTFGPMYCPGCLGTDPVPYFRLTWRLGFVTACPLHKIQLHDHCHQCGNAPWPSGCGIHGMVNPEFRSLRNCWHCSFDLSASPAIELDAGNDITSWLGKDRVNIGTMNVPSLEAFGALRAICQVFLRNRPRTCIERSGTEWARLAGGLSEEAKQTQAVEQLQLEDRVPLVTAGLKIIVDWPNSFVDFANETGISRAHFNGSECLQPPWMTEVVNSWLARRNRSVTAAVLETTITTLTQQLERSPTKTELRRHLAWQGEKGLEKFFVERTQATSAEWHQFLEAIAETERRVAHKARSKNAFACDLAVLLLCLVNGVEINSFAGVRRQSLYRMLISLQQQLREFQEDLLLLIDNVENDLKNFPTIPDRFIFISARQVRKRLNQLMLTLPCELPRDIKVFASPTGVQLNVGSQSFPVQLEE